MSDEWEPRSGVMGVFFLFANPAKRQYLHPGDLGENCKRSGLLRGRHGLALNLLLVPGLADHPLAGSWAGDRVLATGDYAVTHPAADGGDFPTLYDQARQTFENLSYPAVGLLCQFDESLATDMADRAASFEPLFLGLAQLVYEGRNQVVEEALVRRFGNDWPNWHKRTGSSRLSKVIDGQSCRRAATARRTRRP